MTKALPKFLTSKDELLNPGSPEVCLTNKPGNSLTDTNTFSYRIGGKYYLMGNIPLTLDYTAKACKID